jgi:hypothetical protein
MWKGDSSASLGNKTSISFFSHSYPDELVVTCPSPPPLEQSMKEKPTPLAAPPHWAPSLLLWPSQVPRASTLLILPSHLTPPAVLVLRVDGCVSPHLSVTWERKFPRARLQNSKLLV